MMIICPSWNELIDILKNEGLSFSSLRRSPMRIAGRWVAVA